MTRIWTGTATVVQGYTTVVLSGAALTDANCPADATITLDGLNYFVESRVDTTTVELTRAYEGADGSVIAEIDPMTVITSTVANLAREITDYDARLELLDAYGKGLFYTILGVTGANDPGPGYVARNATAWADVTALYLDVLDAGGFDATPLIDEWDDGTIVIVRSIATRGYASFRVLSAPQSQESNAWRLLASLTYLGGDGSLADGEDVAIEWNRLSESGLDVDATVELLADLVAYGGQANGYRVLVNDIGDGRAAVYTLDTSGSPEDWIGPAYVTGPTGATGATGEGLQADAHVATIADMQPYEAQAPGFVVLVDDVGNGRAAYFTLLSTGSPSDWAGPAYVTADGGGDVVACVDRTAIKALDTTTTTEVLLTEDGREGIFLWKSGDYSTHVAADTAEGIYVKATAIASSVGAWVRQVDRQSGVLVDWFGADDTGVADATSALTVAIAVTKMFGGGYVAFGENKYRITTGNIVLDDIRLVGTGVPNLDPSSTGPSVYEDGNTTIMLDGPTNPPFLLGVGWAIEGISFWWPGQVGPVVDTTVPPLFSSEGQVRSTRGELRGCTIFNAYRVFDIDVDGVFGDVLVTENRIFAIKSLLRLNGSMPEYFRVAHNFFSFGIVGALVGETDGAALKTAYVTSGVLIDLDSGAGTYGTTMDGLFCEGNFIFGVNTAFKATTGGLNVSRINDNKFDAVATVFSWDSTGICNGSEVSGNLIYSYKYGDTTAAQDVFETISGKGNTASEYTFKNNKITYAQGRAFALSASLFAKQTLSGNTVINWGMSDTNGNYLAVAIGNGGVSHIVGNSLIGKDAPPAGAVQYGMGVNGTALIVGNTFDNIEFPVVINGGTARVIGNASTGSTTVDLTRVGGTIYGYNDENSWSNPSSAFDRPIDAKNSVRAATTAALAANTRSGNILTASANGALAAQDGVTLILNERLLVKNEGTPANNGIYYVSQVGDASNPFTLTRDVDMDTWSDVPSASVRVQEGTLNADTGWTCTSNAGGTLNTTAITWVQTGVSLPAGTVLGDLLYMSSATALSRLPAGTALQVLRQNGALTAPEWASSRELLTAARTYYVRTDGSDSNTGLVDSAGGAFLTIQKAVDVAFGTLDLGGYDVTIDLGNGTYTGAIAVSSPQVGAGSVILSGDTTTPSNVVVSTTSATCVTVTGFGTKLKVQGFKCQTTTSGVCLNAITGGAIEISGAMEFGTSVGAHIQAERGAQILVSANYTINGGASSHWYGAIQGGIRCVSRTITLTGTPAFTLFAQGDTLASLRVNGCTFSGAATGTRYSSAANSVIFTNGGGATYLPGDVAGSTATGGQYI